MEYVIALPETFTSTWREASVTTTSFPGVYYSFNKWRCFSDVIQWPQTDQLLFVDDAKKRRLYRMNIAGVGQEDQDPETILLANEIRLEDAESLTTDGQQYIYVCTSHALKKRKVKRLEALIKPQAHAFVRFRLSPAGQLIPDGVMKNLREQLAARYDFINDINELPPQKGGLNIEGLAFDRANHRLLVGLRAPLFDGQACLLPVYLNPEMAFSEENLWWQEPITLQIPNKGIRSIQYDSRLGGFLVLTGNIRKGKGQDFALWFWDGNPRGRVRLIESVRFRHTFNPEGVTPVRLSTGEEYIFVVSDNGGGYLKLRYDELKFA